MIYVVLNIQQSQVKAIQNNNNISHLIKGTYCLNLLEELSSSIYS